MDDFLKQALEIAKAQASVRPMSSDEFIAYAKDLANSLRGVSVADDSNAFVTENVMSSDDAKKSIKEKSVTCLVCGKAFKVLGKRHLKSHGLTPAEYRDQFGLKKGTPLIAKGLARARRNKMKDMKLWERRGKNQ